MNPAVEFNPKYEHPFTLEEAILLEIDILIAEIARLQNSIEHLRETQTELQSFINEDPENDEDGELSKAVRENEETIASQSERINLVKVALLNKVGEGGVKHYGLDLPIDPPVVQDSHDTPTSAPIATTHATQLDSGPTPTAVSTEDEGLYL